MREVRIAFYKAQKETWTDRIIAGWTGLFNRGTEAYSHVEIGFEIDGMWKYFSSSIRDNGTRWKNGAVLLKNPDRWDIFSKEYDNKKVKKMIKRARSIEGKKYDKLGIMGFVTISGHVLNDKDSWYCSEACWFILKSKWMKRISPRRMSKEISDLFKQIT